MKRSERTLTLALSFSNLVSLDRLAPELADPPGAFTHTWIFGIQAGRLSFWEPMVTLAYFLQVADGTLLSDANKGVVVTNDDGTTVTVPINIPPAAPEAGFFPQKYSISYSKNTEKIRVTLLDMTQLPESTSDG